jgi:hypothetical protein
MPPKPPKSPRTKSPKNAKGGGATTWEQSLISTSVNQVRKTKNVHFIFLFDLIE